MSSIRPQKIADVLRKEISLIISQDTKDPRLKNINITAVKVSNDISSAVAYYSIVGKSIDSDKSKIDDAVLRKFSGMVRTKLSKIMMIRRVPKIHFKFDESIKYSKNIENLLKHIWSWMVFFYAKKQLA